MSSKRSLRILPLAMLALAATACSDDDDPVDPSPNDGGPADGSAARPDSGLDATIDGAVDAGTDAASNNGDANTQQPGDAGGDAQVPGVITSTAAYLVPVAQGVLTKAILTVGDAVGTKPNGTTPYRMVGIPDGLGARDKGDGTFELLMNHELNKEVGIARAHGGTGAFVSSWTVRKSDLHVLAGKDLIQSVQVWDSTTSSYKLGSNVAFGRFCSADLAAKTAWFNSASGLGFDGQLFLDGEETGSEGRGIAHGLDGVSYELPRLGKYSWENAVASPAAGDKTIVVGLDDTTPGQIYVYVGTKTNAGTPIEKAGLTNGKLFGVAVTGYAVEDATAGIPANTAFTMADLGNVENKLGADIETSGAALNVTSFNRPEDGAWDPSKPNDFYFATTASFTTPSRLWRLRFTNIAQPELGGTVEAVLDGSEGQKMIDNLTIDARGHIVMTEDVGGNDHIGRVYRYDIASDALTVIAQHDPMMFAPSAPNFITRDEEASGVLDASSLLGNGWYLIDVQAHVMNTDPELVEKGQLLAIYDPGSL